MNNVDNGAGKKETRVKIIRESPLGNYSWDTSDSSTNSGYGVNDWSRADLMTELNGDYLNYKSGSTTWYNGRNNQKKANYNYSSGIMNDAKKLISAVKWNLGGVKVTLNNDSSTTNLKNLIPSNVYASEKGTSVYSGRPTSVTKTVGLMYISDFGFSTAGGSSSSRSQCINNISLWVNMSQKTWNNNSYYDCRQNTWFNTRYFVPLSHALTPNTSDANLVFFTNSIDFYPDYTSNAHEVYPVVYLNANVLYKGGDGSDGNPYLVG